MALFPGVVCSPHAVMKWIQDAYYLRLPAGPPMQGDIWRNLPLPYHDPPSGMGIVITPRCDLAHDKSPVVNYLALFELNDFLEALGGFDLLEQEFQNAKEALRRSAEPLHLSELIGLALPVDEALAAIQANVEQKALELKTSVARLQIGIREFEGCSRRVDRIRSCLGKSRLTVAEIVELAGGKAVTRYKLDVARNAVVDLHFLPPCPPLLERPCVAALRAVVTCSIDFLQTAQNCILQRDWEESLSTRSTPDFIASPLKPERILRLKSPYLELLMFRFGTLFGRVGVRDIDRTELHALVDKG
jgi:hypothetical protein